MGMRNYPHHCFLLYSLNNSLIPLNSVNNIPTNIIPINRKKPFKPKLAKIATKIKTISISITTMLAPTQLLSLFHAVLINSFMSIFFIFFCVFINYITDVSNNDIITLGKEIIRFRVLVNDCKKFIRQYAFFQELLNF